MKNLTGGSAEYEALSSDQADSVMHSPINPFVDTSNDSSSTNTDTNVSGGTAPPPRSASQTYSDPLLAPSMFSGSDLDRYPIRKSLMPTDASNTSFSRYSNGGTSYSGKSEHTSMSSIVDENDPFLTNADSSPFGGYPARDFPLHMDEKEADDYLHNPDPIADAAEDRRCYPLDRRGWLCLLAFIGLIGGFITVFVVLPVLDFTGPSNSVKAPNDGVQLSPYSYNILSALRNYDSLIDDDTPDDAKTHTSVNGDKWELVFSDEFNVEGRTFYSGEDVSWEAADLHYDATTDLEWYSPDSCYTEDGVLKIRMDAYENHDLFYRSGMMQSWNKICFTQGYIEIGARLPGNGTIPGLWPGLWTLGNLARPGYLATTEGVWPYSYNECDAGITPNQSSSDGLSYLPGQRLSVCTCQEDASEHPNIGVGRGAPEIDIIEGTVSTPSGAEACGTASQSLQVAPMDIWWMVDYDFIEIYNHSITQMNSWTGGPIQQAVSAATYLNPAWYGQSEERSFQRYGVEYQNPRDTGYISWYIGEDPVYTMYSAALTPNGNIGWRDISREPMSIVMNLGISNSWAYIDWFDIKFPVVLEIDYVRIYQPSGNVSVTCDPDDYPTADYISDHPKAYLNTNATSWTGAGYSWPRNSLVDGCSA